jgi:hypothetical protein
MLLSKNALLGREYGISKVKTISRINEGATTTEKIPIKRLITGYIFDVKFNNVSLDGNAAVESVKKYMHDIFQQIRFKVDSDQVKELSGIHCYIENLLYFGQDLTNFANLTTNSSTTVKKQQRFRFKVEFILPNFRNPKDTILNLEDKIKANDLILEIVFGKLSNNTNLNQTMSDFEIDVYEQILQKKTANNDNYVITHHYNLKTIESNNSNYILNIDDDRLYIDHSFVTFTTDSNDVKTYKNDVINKINYFGTVNEKIYNDIDYQILKDDLKRSLKLNSNDDVDGIVHMNYCRRGNLTDVISTTDDLVRLNMGYSNLHYSIDVTKNATANTTTYLLFLGRTLERNNKLSQKK